MPPHFLGAAVLFYNLVFTQEIAQRGIAARFFVVFGHGFDF